MMTPLRFAMLTTFYPPYSHGGDAIAVRRLAHALVKRGHSVTVIHDVDAYRGHPAEEDRGAWTGQGGNLEVIGLSSRLPKVSNLLTHQLGRPVVHGRRLDELLRPGSHDIFWFHNISLVGGPALLSYGDGLKVYEAHEHWLVCPTNVLWRHNREPCRGRECFRCSLHYRRPPQLWRALPYYRRQLDRVDVFIAKSEFSRGQHGAFGLGKSMEVVPYFLPDREDRDSAVTAPSNAGSANRPYFLFVGRLEAIKGLDRVLPLFAEDRGADLLIAGTGGQEAELRRQANGFSNIRFLGKLGSAELADYYRDAVALIVPSLCYETFGIITIEAFREGTPVIARDIGPFAEIINKCGGGLLYSNEGELVAAIRKLQEDSSCRDALGRSARAGFESFWNEETVLGKYFDVLRKAALEKGDTGLAAALEQGG